MTNVPRKHHFVTKAYLDGFLVPPAGHLFCYGRKRKSPFQGTPGELANIRDYYSFKTAEGVLDCSLEQRIEREIEAPGLLVLKSLAGRQTRLSHAQRMALSRLIALQCLRVPYERDFIDSHYRADLVEAIRDMDGIASKMGRAVNEMEVTFGIPNQMLRDDQWQRVSRKTIESLLEQCDRNPAWYSLQSLIPIASSLAPFIEKMQWTLVVVNGNERLLTTDCPVVRTISESGGPHGLNEHGCQIYFPLTGTSLLNLKRPPIDVLGLVRKKSAKQSRSNRQKRQIEVLVSLADEARVQRLNEMLLDEANLWVFSGTSEPWIIERMQTPAKRPQRVEAIHRSETIRRVVEGREQTTILRQYTVSR